MTTITYTKSESSFIFKKLLELIFNIVIVKNPLRKGTALTKEMFLNHLYGGMDEPELKIIDVFVCKLRKKLVEATGEDSCIQTVWGRGYVLKDPLPDMATQKIAV